MRCWRRTRKGLRKLCFRSELAASIRAAWLASRSGQTQRPYRCPHCGWWHLTSGAPGKVPGMTESASLPSPYKVQEVSDVELAFPARVRHLMPAYDEIPDEFKRGRTLWNEVMNEWMFRGLSREAKFLLKDGIDGEKMIRHIRAILGSFQPKHEHKEAAIAFLLSTWCDDITDYKVPR